MTSLLASAGTSPTTAAQSLGINASTASLQISHSATLALYERELAWFRADEVYLSVEKSAARCAKLSALLTAATLDIITERA